MQYIYPNCFHRQSVIVQFIETERITENLHHVFNCYIFTDTFSISSNSPKVIQMDNKHTADDEVNALSLTVVLFPQLNHEKSEKLNIGIPLRKQRLDLLLFDPISVKCDTIALLENNVWFSQDKITFRICPTVPQPRHIT